MKYSTVVITGGSSGIGLDLAKSYTKQGSNVVLIARNQSKLDEAAKACRGLVISDKQMILTFSVDVADQQALALCVNAVESQLGTPELLILSAGIVQSVRFLEQTDDDFDAIMQTNVMGSRAVAKAFLPAMVERGKGQVCFVSSLGGIISTYGYSAYSASKFAVLGMAGALRQELHEFGVGVSVLCPPEVDTPMVAQESEHILPQTRFIKDIGGTLDVSTVTKAAVKGIANNRFIIVPGLMAKVSYAQARFMPRVFGWFMQKLVGLSTRFVKSAA